MQVTVVRPSELGRSEAGQWRAFQASSLTMSQPFLSLSYARVWEAAKPSARVAVVEDSGRIEAFIPFEIGDGRIASPLGGAYTAIDGMVTSGAPLDMRAVVRKAGLRGWRFDRAPVDQKALDAHRYSGSHHCRTVSYVDLSGGYDKYLSDLSDGTRKRIARTEAYRRALQRKMGEVSFEWSNPKPEYFDQLFQWKSDQFRNARRTVEDPVVMPALRELAFMDNDDCRGLMGVLSAGEQTAAVTMCLEGPGVIALYTLGYNPEFARFSAGTMQLLDLIRDAVTHGIAMVDFGADYTVTENTYKDRFRNATYELTGGAVWASRIEAKARSIYRMAKYRG
jgi:CelD/BcsL family acetyltransferase involved in cellulose biosynthesis